MMDENDTYKGTIVEAELHHSSIFSYFISELAGRPEVMTPERAQKQDAIIDAALMQEATPAAMTAYENFTQNESPVRWFNLSRQLDSTVIVLDNRYFTAVDGERLIANIRTMGYDAEQVRHARAEDFASEALTPGEIAIIVPDEFIEVRARESMFLKGGERLMTQYPELRQLASGKASPQNIEIMATRLEKEGLTLMLAEDEKSYSIVPNGGLISSVRDFQRAGLIMINSSPQPTQAIGNGATISMGDAVVQLSESVLEAMRRGFDPNQTQRPSVPAAKPEQQKDGSLTL